MSLPVDHLNANQLERRPLTGIVIVVFVKIIEVSFCRNYYLEIIVQLGQDLS